jgi:hypothetical protein
MSMTRLFALAAAVSAALVLVPATAADAAPGHDQVTGTGVLGQFGNPATHVNAVETPTGLKGGFTVQYPDTTQAAGTALCLSVTGSTAFIVAQITSASGPRQTANNWFPGGYLVIGVQDNGDPGAQSDRVNFSPGFATEPACGPNDAAQPVFLLVDGNYQVFDAG